jgi:hypothetical protein
LLKKWTDAHARIRDAVFDICITIRETFQKCIKEPNQTSYHSDILVTSQQQQKKWVKLNRQRTVMYSSFDLIRAWNETQIFKQKQRLI